jgi:hypothetical protein
MRSLWTLIFGNLIIFVAAAVAALILYKLGGSIAEVTGQSKTFLGLTFKAGGALAGFLIMFLASYKGMERLKRISQDVDTTVYKIKLFLKPNGGRFPKEGDYECNYKIKTDAGNWKELPATHWWEAGHLTLETQISAEDLMVVTVKDKTNQTYWESESFNLLSHNIDMEPKIKNF